MAKFIKITCYYFGLRNRQMERLVNFDFIEKIEVSTENTNHSYLFYKNGGIMVVEKPITEVLTLLS